MKRLATVVFAVVFLTSLAAGQVMRATLTGRVTDSTGAVLPNAQIVVTNTETGATATV